MRTALGLFVLLAFAAPAGAKTRSCAEMLFAQKRGARIHKLEFDRSGTRARRGFVVPERDLEGFVAKYGLTLVPHPEGGLYGIVFEPDPTRLDRGFVLRGTRVDDVFVVHSFYPSDPERDDVPYFHRVAELHAVMPRKLKLEKAILNCPSLVIHGWTQVKLWLKHRLPVSEVVEFLNSVRAKPELNRFHHPNGRSRFVVDEYDRRGRQLRVVIQEEGMCPNGLITAFEIR